MRSQRHREHAVQLLEHLALGLGHEEQRQEEADGVPPSVPAEGGGWAEGLEHGGPGHCQHEFEEPGGGRSDGHALLDGGVSHHSNGGGVEEGVLTIGRMYSG